MTDEQAQAPTPYEDFGVKIEKMAGELEAAIREALG